MEDLVKIYLKEAGKTPLLTPQEEREKTTRLVNLRQQYYSLLCDTFIGARIYTQAAHSAFIVGESKDCYEWFHDRETILERTTQKDLARILEITQTRSELESSPSERESNELMDLVSLNLYPLSPKTEGMELLRERLSRIRTRNENPTEGILDSPGKLDWTIKNANHLSRLYLKEREGIMNANLRLVISIAKRTGYRLDFLDRIQAGNLGLQRALETFDPTMENKLSTYATTWIEQYIGREEGNYCRTIRIPVHASDLLMKIKKVEKTLEQKLGRRPTTEETALEMKINVERLNDIINANYSTSLDEPLNDEGDADRYNLVSDTSPGPDSSAMSEDLQEKLYEAMEFLTDKEKEILVLRFGLNGADRHTLEEIGQLKKVTRERIRQIEAQALKKMRHPSRIKQLKEF